MGRPRRVEGLAWRIFALLWLLGLLGCLFNCHDCYDAMFNGVCDTIWKGLMFGLHSWFGFCHELHFCIVVLCFNCEWACLFVCKDLDYLLAAILHIYSPNSNSTRMKYCTIILVETWPWLLAWNLFHLLQQLSILNKCAHYGCYNICKQGDTTITRATHLDFHRWLQRMRYHPSSLSACPEEIKWPTFSSKSRMRENNNCKKAKSDPFGNIKANGLVNSTLISCVYLVVLKCIPITWAVLDPAQFPYISDCSVGKNTSFISVIQVDYDFYTQLLWWYGERTCQGPVNSTGNIQLIDVFGIQSSYAPS